MTHIDNHPARRRARRARRAAAAGAASLALLAAGACALDVTNPNAATEEQVLTTPAGMRALTVGLQGRLGTAIEEAVWIPGLVSGEIGNTNASQATQREFQRFPEDTANTEITNTNPELLDLWARHYALLRTANDVLDNVDDVTLAPGTRSGMTALARTGKALAFGTLIESFEQIVIMPEQDDPPFVDRATALAEALALLAQARADLDAQAPSAEFTALLAPGFNLPATIRALQARYALAAGQYAQALAFANEVPAAATSVYSYTATDPNPLRQQIQALGYFGALSSFRTQAEAGDTRVARFTTATATTAFGGATLVGINVFRDVADPIPVFTQEELTLIRAEAQARLNQLPEARTLVNAVRTANGLPARDAATLGTQQAILDEIYRQRRYSLFLTGLRWSDQRRFGRLSEAKVAYLPYPLSETNTNPNTPPNP
jgi:starch-binding outer membrane protein, SusD/RagB family